MVAAGLAIGAYLVTVPAEGLSPTVSIPHPPGEASTLGPEVERSSTGDDFPTRRPQVAEVRGGKVNVPPSATTQAEPGVSPNVPAQGGERDLSRAADPGAVSTLIPESAPEESTTVNGSTDSAKPGPAPASDGPKSSAPSLAAGQAAALASVRQQPPKPGAPQTAGSDSDDQVELTPKKGVLKYPNLSAHLTRLAASVENGQAPAQEAANNAAVHWEEPVAVTIYISGSVEAVVRFLEDKGGDPRNVGDDYIEAYVPVTLLGAVSELSGVTRVREIVPPRAGGPLRSGGPGRP